MAGAHNSVASLKPIFQIGLATLFAPREAKTSIRQRDWLKLAGEKIRREQVGTVPTFFVCSREQIRQVENTSSTRHSASPPSESSHTPTTLEIFKIVLCQRKQRRDSKEKIKSKFSVD